jgi:hypothetical protein
MREIIMPTSNTTKSSTQSSFGGMGGSRSKELFDAARAGDEGGVEAALENGATMTVKRRCSSRR